MGGTVHNARRHSLSATMDHAVPHAMSGTLPPCPMSNCMPLSRYRRTPETSISSMIPNLSLASLMSFARAFSSVSSVSTFTARGGCTCPLMRAASRSDVADICPSDDGHTLRNVVHSDLITVPRIIS